MEKLEQNHNLNLDKNARHFLYYVKGKCKKHSIKLSLRNTKYVKIDGSKCSGYFDDANRIIVVAMNKSDALEILVHEFCHLTQFLDQCKSWTQLGTSLDKIWAWLSGVTIDNIDDCIDKARDMELDNEMRSVEMIKRFKLNINTKHYIAKANSYVYFYNWMKTSRKWSKPENSPYNNKRLLAAMPKRFQTDYGQIPNKLEKIFREESI